MELQEARGRIPPGQYVSQKWPVLHVGPVPPFDPGRWDLKVFGLVEEELVLGWEEFSRLPRKKVLADFHCVTRFSVLNNLWEGVSSRTLLELARPKATARHVLVWAEYGYSANLTLEDFLRDDVLFALRRNGEPLSPEHGGPVRLVVPHLYAWKSVKWVRGVEVLEEEVLGYWEARGYHRRGDPWAEERFALAPVPPMRARVWRRGGGPLQG